MAARVLRRRRKVAAYGVRRRRGVAIATRRSVEPTLTGDALQRFIEEDRREEFEALSWLRLSNKSRLDQFAE